MVSGYLGLIVALPVLAYLAAWITPGWPWSTRATPADALRVVTGIAFAGFVSPALGILAMLGAGWWYARGWERLAGGLLWPTVAMAILLGISAPPSSLDAAVSAILVMGIGQTGLAVAQALRILSIPGGVHGTFGHRTGLGIYLAMLCPLAFVTDYGWPLVAVYAIGILVSRSAVAAVASSAGLVVLMPSLAPLLVGGAVVGIVLRSIKWNRGHPKPRHFADSWRMRFTIWRVTARRCLGWPVALVGHGPGAFGQDARTWIASDQVFGEVFNEAHNDYLEFAYEHGLIGVLAAGLWLYAIAPALAWGDGPTGALVAFGTAMLANFPMKVAPLVATAGVVVVLLMRRVA